MVGGISHITRSLNRRSLRFGIVNDEGCSGFSPKADAGRTGGPGLDPNDSQSRWNAWKVKSLSVVLFVVLAGGAAWALGRNIAPDAVTKATEGYNLYTGELTYLTDGKVPDNDEAPGVFQWGNKGILVFELPEPVAISEVRICVGEHAAPYIVTFFSGAKLGADGQSQDPEGERKGIVENYDYVTHQWVSLKPETPVVADYVELETMNGPEMYEVEILIEDGTTPVQPSSWGLIKTRFLISDTADVP